MAVAVDVIIRTLAERERGAALLRALDSLLCRQSSTVRPIVVMNGNRCDPALVDRISSMPGVLATRAPGALRSAFFVGRERVSSEFFAFLDDDDEYLPSALDRMQEIIAGEDDVDLLVMNGYRLGEGGARTLVFDNAEAIATAPLRALLVKNWLYNCGTLYRSDSFPSAWFEDLPDPMLFEWTWIACKAATEKTIRFRNEPAFNYHNTPGSLSKTWDMALAEEGILRALETIMKDRPEKRLLRVKRGQALHAASDLLRQDGRLREAWVYHLHSLRQPHGWRYLPYSRHLLAPVARA